MPMSNDFKKRLFPNIADIIAHFGSPFHIYDEKGILQTGKLLKNVFSAIPGFMEYFAVKALPNPTIMSLMKDMGFGFDCSSIPELVLSRNIGATDEEIMFTSNNTTNKGFETAFADGGCIINLDDISLISKLPEIPELISFRYNPGPKRTGNNFIGKPVEAKYGVSNEQIINAYQEMINRGVKRFGIHTMLASNELNYTYLVETAQMLLSLVADISTKLGIKFEFINIGGGMGIPYHPDDDKFNITDLAKDVTTLFKVFKQGQRYMPKLFIESGRYMTGPHGVLVTKAINIKNIYRKYIGVDACMSALMRPGIYGAYHHIDVLNPNGKNTSGRDKQIVDVVGALCENTDKFAIQRKLPIIIPGDIVVIQDTGAHGHAMGFNYNAQLRPKELLLKKDGTVELIRREETMADYFATLKFEKQILKL